MKQFNWLAILVCLVAGMGIGFLWYGLLFLDPWQVAHNLTLENEIYYKNGNPVEVSNTPMIFNAITMVIYAIIISWLVVKTNMWGFVKGATVGLLVGAVSCINMFTTNLFAFNPIEATLYDGLYIIVLLAIMGGIIGAWRKK